jgi:hypothetical protein
VKFFSAHRRRSTSKIPAFLSIDVEPDGFQLSRSNPPRWSGYDAILPVTERLRSELIKISGRSPKFGWYFRTDPQIADVYGRADYGLTEFSERVAFLKEKGDYFGVHSHPIRWCSERQLWVHDFIDADWNAECARVSLDAFARWNGAPAQRFRGGAGFLTEKIVDVLEHHGVSMEMSLEPVGAWPRDFSAVPTGIDSSPYDGVHAGCLDAPRTAYRPSRNNFRTAVRRGARNLTIVPLSTYVIKPWQPRSRNLIDTLMRIPRNQEVRVLHMSEQWPNGKFYWDLVAHQLSSMPHPYLSLAVRTDAPGSPPLAHAQRLLDALFEHPLVETLEFGDPVDIVPGLV